MLAIFGSANASADVFTLDITHARIDLGSLQNADILAPPSSPATLTGTINAASGDYSVPKESFSFPPQTISTPVGDATVGLVAEQDITGNFNASTGQMSSHLVFQANVEVPAVAASCSIGPVTLDLSTETLRPYHGKRFDSGSGLTGDGGVSAAWASLPTPTGGSICSTLGALIAGQGAIWLGRGAPPSRVDLICPGDIGCKPVDPPTCATDASLCTPKIGSVSVTPAKAKVKAGKSVTLTAKVSNTGDGEAGGVKVCATGPKSKVKVPKCSTVSIPAGGSKTVKLKVTAQKKAKGKATVTVTAGSSSAGSKKDTSMWDIAVNKKA